MLSSSVCSGILGGGNAVHLFEQSGKIPVIVEPCRMGDVLDAERGLIGQQPGSRLQPHGVDVFDRRDGKAFFEIF